MPTPQSIGAPASLRLVVAVLVALHVTASGVRPEPRGERGQATAEYALVLLGVAAVALIFGAWATRTGKIGELFDSIVDQLIDRAG